MHDSSTIFMSRSGDEPTPDLEVPRQLGSVRLVRQLGKGGMGVVWLGRDDMLARDVAVKFLLGAVASPDDPDFETFLAGARAAAALKHPGLTAVHHAGLVERVPYIVMEFVDGPGLDQVIHQTGALPAPVAFFALRSVCAAIGELHDHSITHRDIKPANILLDRDARLVVTDFGLSCQRRYGEAQGRITVGGTPNYMSSEMFDGDSSPRSDVYALGILAFELFTGAPPFHGTLAEIRAHHQSTPLPTDRLAALPPELTAAIERATNKNPRLRYRTAQHFALALDSVRIPDAAQAQAVAELSRRIAVCRGEAHPDAPPAPKRDSTVYYENLSTIAATRRAETPPPVIEPSVAAAATRAGTIAHSISCLKCQYDLRGLEPSANCPECGMPVARSTRPDRLVFADPGWLRRIILGQRITLIGAACYVLAIPIITLIVLLLPRQAAAGLGPAPKAGGFMVAGIALAAVTMLTLLVVPVGVWLFTRPEPRRSQPWARRARILGRWSTLLCAALAVPLSIPSIQSHAALFRSLGAIAILCLTLSPLGLAYYLRTLAQRIPETKLSRSAGSVVIIALVLLVVWPILLTYSYIVAPVSGGMVNQAAVKASQALFIGLRAFGNFVLIITAIYAFFLLGLAYRRFQPVARAAFPHDALCTDTQPAQAHPPDATSAVAPGSA